MKKHLLFITIAAIGINACSFTEDLEDPQDLELSPINFGNGRVMGSTTKAKEKTSTWVEGDNIGIFAMLHKKESNNLFTVNFANNIKLTYTTNTDTWNADSPLYWPANTDDRITFFAYHPHSTTKNDGAPAVQENGEIKIIHRSSVIPANQTDLLWDWVNNAHKTDMNGDETGTPTTVPFEFKHALTKISFTAKTTIDYEVAQVTITNLSMHAKTENTLTIKASEATWDLSSATEMGTCIIIPGRNNTTGDIELVQGDPTNGDAFTKQYHELLMVPQNLIDNKISITYTIQYKEMLGNTGALVKETKILSLADIGTTTWTKNTHVTYNIIISALEIDFSATVLDNWGDPTSEDVP